MTQWTVLARFLWFTISCFTKSLFLSLSVMARLRWPVWARSQQRSFTMTSCGSFVEYRLVNYDGQFRRVRWIEISSIDSLEVMASSGSFTGLITPYSCLGCCSKSKNLEIMIFKLSYRIYFSTKIKYILTYKRLSRTTSKWIWRMKGRRIYSTKQIYRRTILLSI